MNTQKRFWLFAGDNYYPSGGMKDFKGSFDTAEEATTASISLHIDWWEVYDTQECKIVGGNSNPL